MDDAWIDKISDKGQAVIGLLVGVVSGLVGAALVSAFMNGNLAPGVSLPISVSYALFAGSVFALFAGSLVYLFGHFGQRRMWRILLASTLGFALAVVVAVFLTALLANAVPFVASMGFIPASLIGSKLVMWSLQSPNDGNRARVTTASMILPALVAFGWGLSWFEFELYPRLSDYAFSASLLAPWQGLMLFAVARSLSHSQA